jgi:hypothetical protein
MATKRKRAKRSKPKEEDPSEDGISEEEAEAMAGAPADGEDEMPPMDIEHLTPFPEVDELPEGDEEFQGQGMLGGFDYPEELNPLGVRDDSVSKARDAASIMREANASLLLHRVEPSEYRGHRTRGYIKRFHAPFSVEEAQVWAAENRGGGKYRYWIYDGGGTIRGGSTFEIAGTPLTPQEIAEAESAAATKQQPERGDRDRERELESQLANERMDRMMQMMMQQRREDQAETRRLMEKLADSSKNQRSSVEEWAPLIAALAPVLTKVLEKPEPPPPPPDHFKELAVLQERFQTEMMRLNRDQLEKSGKPDRTEAIMLKMLEATMQKSLGIGQHDPMSGINMALDKVLPTLVSKITNIAIDKAAVAGKEEEKDLSPRFIAEKVADLVKDTTDKFANRGQQPQGPPPGYGPPMAPMALPPGTMPGNPSAPIEGWPLTGAPGADVVPPPQQAHAAMRAPAAPPNAVEIPPGATVGGITNNGPNTLYIDPMAVTEVPAQAPTVAAPMPEPVTATPVTATPVAAPADTEQPQHVHPDIFAKAVEFLQTGQSGEDLAVWADDNNEGHKLLSKDAIEYLENTQPFYLVPFILEAAPPELAAHLNNPHAKQMISDFCDFFYNSEDPPEGEDAELTPDAAAPPASLTPEVPSE